MPLTFSSDLDNKNPDYNRSVQYQDDLIEVKDDGNFRRHYLHWSDKDADWQAYYDLAMANEPANQYKFRIAFIFPKNAVLRSVNTRAEDFHPLEATVDYDESKLEDFKDRNKSELDKYLVAATRGFLKTSMREAVVPDLIWEFKGTEWSGNVSESPTADALTFQLKKLGWTTEEIDEINAWFLIQPELETLNKTANKQKITLQYAGTAQQFGQSRFANGLLVRIPESVGPGVLAHELTHLFTSNFKKTHAYLYCPFHGGGRMGYADVPGSSHPWIGANNPSGLYDFNMLRYYISRRMWQTYGQVAAAPPPITASPNGYRYSQVDQNYTTLLPRLTQADIETLLGVGLKISYSDSFTLFKVNWADRKLVQSPHHLSFTSSSVPSNCLDRNVNNVAVLKVPSGHWLFVKPELMELFCDMPRQADYDVKAGQNWLPLYGFLTSGDGLGLVLIKAPASLRTVEAEIRYFVQGFAL